MSWSDAHDPSCDPCESTPVIETIIEPRKRDLGGFSVGRVLPSVRKRMVGPFIFFDEMGPAEFPPGEGINVRPHPHINLATVTYLFEGEIEHRDSLGSHRVIHPGAINWMTAGRGIVHSERTRAEVRARTARLHGIQLWLALPKEHEETEPEFFHHPADTIPKLEKGGVTLRVLAGEAFGEKSPVRTYSPLFYVDAHLEANSTLELAPEYADRAAYVTKGKVRCDSELITQPKMLVFRDGASVALHAEEDARVLLLGGQPLSEQRHIWWNFVSSDPARIERAKADWREGRFEKVPGDDQEFTPLPQSSV